MTATARLIRHDDVGVIELDNPPVNALALGLRAGLSAALDAALADPSIVAIVLAGAGRMFCGGADLREFNTPAAAQPPATTDLRGRMERAPKPVVAAIHGSALGGGLEMALACHYRVASTGTKLGLPEVQRGLLPGGGGTQRLPRLVGVATALEMIVGGEPVDAARARAIGLVDEVVDGDVRAAAVAFARRKAAVTAPGSNACTRPAGPTKLASATECAPMLAPTSSTVSPGRKSTLKRRDSDSLYSPSMSRLSLTRSSRPREYAMIPCRVVLQRQLPCSNSTAPVAVALPCAHASAANASSEVKRDKPLSSRRGISASLHK